MPSGPDRLWMLGLSIGLALLVTVKHRGNIQRLLAGTESRIGHAVRRSRRPHPRRCGEMPDTHRRHWRRAMGHHAGGAALRKWACRAPVGARAGGGGGHRARHENTSPSSPASRCPPRCGPRTELAPAMAQARVAGAGGAQPLDARGVPVAGSTGARGPPARHRHQRAGDCHAGSA